MGKFTVKKEGDKTFLLTPRFRVSFPNVFTPDEFGKYSLGMLFPRDTDFKLLEKLIAQAKKHKWPNKTPKKFLHPILDGEESEREEYTEYMYINGKSGKYAPGIVDANRDPIVNPEEFYGGCYARAKIGVYAWEYMGKTGVSVAVASLQKLDDGEPFVGRVSAEDDFDAVELDEEDIEDDDDDI